MIDGSDGLPMLMDWVSQGDMVIVDVSPIIDYPERLSAVIDPLMIFVEQQLGGQLLNFGHSRLLLLPSNPPSNRNWGSVSGDSDRAIMPHVFRRVICFYASECS